MSDTTAEAQPVVHERTAVFVSYSRRDQDFVARLAPTLEQRGLEVWVDLEDIGPATDWSDEIRHGIEAAEAVIVVVSPDSSASTEVGKEIDWAEALGKRIVPLLHRPIEPSDAHPAVARRNWVSWLSDDEAAEALAKIDQSLTADPAWAKEHTRLQGQALEWDRNNRERSRLLSGSALDQAEAAVIVDRPPEQPQVTELMRGFAAESRVAASKRQRRLLFTAVGVAAVSITLAIVALVFRQEAATQRDEAVRQRDTATAAALAAESRNAFAAEPDLAALLALEAFRTTDSVDARGSLLNVVDAPTTFVQRFFAHEQPITRIVEHPEVSLLATADEAGQVVLWDIGDDGRAEPRADAIDTGAEVTSLAFDPEALRLSVATTDDEVQVWEVGDSGHQVLTRESFPVEIALSSDGALGAGIGVDDSDTQVGVAAFDVATGDQLNSTELAIDIDDLGDFETDTIRFSPDQTQIALFAGTDIHVWDWFGTGDVTTIHVDDLAIPDADRLSLVVTSVAFVDERDRFAFGTDEGGVYLFDLADPFTPPGDAFPASASSVWALDAIELVNDDGAAAAETVLASSHNNGEVKVWFVDEEGAFEAASLRGHDEEVRAVAVTSAGGVVSGSFDGDVIWSTILPTAYIGEGIAAPGADTTHPIDVSDVEFVGQDQLVSVDLAGSARTWDPRTGEPQSQEADGSSSLAAAGEFLAVGGLDGSVYTVDASGTVIDFDMDHDDLVEALAVSPDASTVVSTDETEVWVWDASGSRTAIASLPDDFDVNSVVHAGDDAVWVGGASVDGDQIAHAIRIDPATGAETARVRHNQAETGHEVTSIAVSPDGTTLATGGSDRRIYVWDATDLDQPRAELEGHLDSVTGLVFFDDRLLLAADADGAVRLWDVGEARSVGELTGPSDGINAIALDPDRTLLAAASEDDVVWTWDLRPASWLGAACDLAGRNLSEAEWQQFQLDGEPVRHCEQFAPVDWPVAIYPSGDEG